MKRKPHFDELAVKKIVEMYESGENTLGKIADEFKTTAATVRTYLIKHGVYKGRKNKRKNPACAAGADMNSEVILRKLKAAESEVVRLKRELNRAVAREEKRFQRLKRIIKS